MKLLHSGVKRGDEMFNQSQGMKEFQLQMRKGFMGARRWAWLLRRHHGWNP